jgi:predicted RNA binding protein YcfA (HicA-like mRNA interferase family)
MTRLPVLPGADVVRAFEAAGWRVARRRGSHVILEKPGHDATLSVPVHTGQAVKRGTLRSLIRDAGMSVEAFAGYL